MKRFFFKCLRTINPPDYSVFNDLHDSNSIFFREFIENRWFSDGTVIKRNSKKEHADTVHRSCCAAGDEGHGVVGQDGLIIG